MVRCCRSLGRVDVQQAVALSRDELESGLHAIALLLFRNELKLDTAAAIQDLKAGQVRCPSSSLMLLLSFFLEYGEQLSIQP